MAWRMPSHICRCAAGNLDFSEVETHIDEALSFLFGTCCPRVVEAAWPTNETDCTVLDSASVTTLSCDTSTTFRVNTMNAVQDHIIIPVTIVAWVVVVPQVLHAD